jgi:dolichol-phosphate mannosyltransferase
VLPAFDEEGNIERAVRSAAEAVAPLVRSYEIVAVDDGSRDRTAEILSALEVEMTPRLRVVRHPSNRGYGAALRSGFEAARGDLVFYTDSDNQFDLRELKDVLPLVSGGDDAFLGFRVNRQDPWLRRFVSAGFNRLSCLVLGFAVRDINCSFKLFRRDKLQSLPLESSDFFIDTEMVALIHHHGWRYVQRGVSHLPRTAGRSTVRPRDIPRTLVALARMWVRLRSLGIVRAAA